MRFYILHAHADRAAAEELRNFLKTRGPPPELDDGSQARHLQPSDVLIALWSEKAVFSNSKMQMEKRMLDAWADEQLVLVKLDHGLLPVGLRDLPVVDAGFASGRALHVWPQVEHTAKEAMNAALVARQRQPTPPVGPGSSGAQAPVPSPSFDPPGLDAFASRVAPRWPGLVMLAAVAAIGWTAFALLFPSLNPAPQWVTLAIAAVGGVAILALVILVMGSGAKASRSVTGAAKRAAPTTPPKASAQTWETAVSGAAPTATTVFISYAHADNAQVEPIVKAVEASGRTVWIDKGGIQAGEGWAGEIVRGIKRSKGVLVMCSPRAFESDHIKREVYLADRYKKPMLPVFIEAASPPEDFEYFFASVQWLELFKLPEADRPAAIGKALAAV